MVFAVGCSSKSSGGSSGTGGGSSGDTCSNAANDCIVQPPMPSGGSGTGVAHNYAVHKLYLGDTDRTGTGSPTAWKAYGYNLDNLVTKEACDSKTTPPACSNDVCSLTAGAAKETQIDGNGGIDNSFGENILPIVLTTAGSGAGNEINTSIAAGSFTVMMDVTGFDDSAGNQTNATGLTGFLLAGGNYTTQNGGAAPTWDPTTHWPILPSLMTGCTESAGCPAGTDPKSAATITFPSAYQAGGTFVNGTPAELTLTLSIAGEQLSLAVESAIITFQPVSPGSVTNGTIAGVLVTTDLVNALQSVAGSISPSLCSGSAFQSIAQQIEQASDIISTGNAVSNVAGTPCNAISIGLGFDATEIAQPTSADILGPVEAGPNPCDDAGTGGD
ncbi:MAG TPA: hypothetical protein VGG39_25955 [Polyangiaceae bacterium]